MDNVSYRHHRLTINDQHVEFPIDNRALQGALGRNDRAETYDDNKLLTWDSKGVIGYAKPGGFIFELVFQYTSKSHPFSPLCNFPGLLQINNELVEPMATQEDLEKAGLESSGSFLYESQDRDRYVLAEYDNKLILVSFGTTKRDFIND